MPELPEVETIRAQLEKVLVGQVVEGIEVLREKSWSGVVEEVVGREIVAIGRKGKMLHVELVAPRKRLVHLTIHLKMTGQLIYQQTTGEADGESERVVGGHPSAAWVKELPDKHTRVVVKLREGVLYFNDMRVFGWVRQVEDEQLESLLSRMPPDVIDEKISRIWFRKLLSGSNRPVKLVVMDSGKLGGVGNIYANDGLWEAGIDPRRTAKSLSNSEADKLLAALKKVVWRGIELGGATASDDKFVQVSGLGGKYQDEFRVYERAGEKCLREGCGGVIEKIKIGGRGTYFCPKCQN